MALAAMSCEKLDKQNSNKIVYAFALLFVFSLAILFPDLAHAAGGLSKAESGMTKFTNDILPLVRLACILGVIGCGLGYVFQWSDNKRVFQIFIGILIIASASEFVNIVWG